MEDKQAKFRILKKGYDRFAVDDTIDRLNFDLQQKDQQLEKNQGLRMDDVSC